MKQQTNLPKRKLSGKRVLAGCAILLAAVLIIAGAAYFLTRWLAFTWEDKNNLISSDGLYSHSALLLDLQTGQVLSRKNGDQSIYPASLTKLMTVYLAVKELDPQQVITLDEPIFPPLYAQQASLAGFEPGERVSALDLMYGALLPSGAECCVGLAQAMAGSETAFAEQMNREAKNLGMKHTHFVNSTGLQDKDHYSTAEDLALLLDTALEEPLFYQIFTTHSYTATGSFHPFGLTFTGTLWELPEAESLKNGIILGGKTGYTQEAGLCLASLAEVGGREYLLVTAGAKGDHSTPPYHLYDALTLYGRIQIS